MTREEAIKILEPITCRDALMEFMGGSWNQTQAFMLIGEAQKMGLDALRMQESARSNDPLTLEQLREMDGEPVWTVALDYGASRWAFVSADCEVVRYFTTRCSVACDVIGRHFRTYGKTWLAYRRKPEEETA